MMIAKRVYAFLKNLDFGAAGLSFGLMKRFQQKVGESLDGVSTYFAYHDSVGFIGVFAR